MILAWASAHHVVYDTCFLKPLKLRIAHYGWQKNGKRDWILLTERALTPQNSPTATLRHLFDVGANLLI